MRHSCAEVEVGHIGWRLLVTKLSIFNDSSIYQKKESGIDSSTLPEYLRALYPKLHKNYEILFKGDKAWNKNGKEISNEFNC